MDLNKRIDPDNNSRTFHSNGYAEINDKNTIRRNNFELRQKINFNRQIVGGYNRSMIGSSRTEIRAKSINDSQDSYRGQGVIRPIKQIDAMPKNTPKPRNYDPFA